MWQFTAIIIKISMSFVVETGIKAIFIFRHKWHQENQEILKDIGSKASNQQPEFKFYYKAKAIQIDSFLILMNWLFLMSNILSIFLNLLSLLKVEGDWTLFCIRSWLKGILWLVWYSTQTIWNFFHISNKAAALSYHSRAHWSSTFNFYQEIFLCIYNLTL